MIRHPRRLVLALALMATVALSGCTVHQRLATQAVSFNLALEKSQNEMLLLNVIRAKDRLPMYLTGMSTLTGNVQTTIGATAGGSYTRTKGSTAGSTGSSMTGTMGDTPSSSTGSTVMQGVSDMLAHAYTPSATASEMENPTYSLTVLDTQEFMKGFMSPLGKDTFAYYWGQKWPGPVLLYLLVERIEERRDEDNTIKVWSNYPDVTQEKLDDLNKFGDKVKEFLAKNPTIEQTPAPENIGPELSIDRVQDLDDLVKVAKEKLALTHCKDSNYRLQRMGAEFGFKVAASTKCEKKNDQGADKNKKLGEDDPCKDKTAPGSSTSDDPLSDKKERMEAKTDECTSLTFVLRSPEALLYYLGELMRVENRTLHPKIPEVCIQKHFQPLFLALPSGSCSSALLSAEASQGFYSVPPNLDKEPDGCADGEFRLRDPEQGRSTCDGGRSMQAFRLLNQVMSLQKSAKDNPSPALVRVIGQ